MFKSHAHRTMDMTEGSLLTKVLFFSLPIMLSGILQLLFNAADTIVVGRFAGNEALAAVGSVGALSEKLHVRDIILAQGACTNSAYASQFGCRGAIAPIADYGLLRTAADIAEERGLRYAVGNLLSSDTFYDDDKTASAAWIKMGVLGIEMEAAALYLNAMRAGKKALAICTVSDHVITGEETTAEERQTSFRDMMELALEVAVRS